jgi:hypothetical protein
MEHLKLWIRWRRITPLDLTADPAKLAEDLEQTRRVLLDRVVGIEDTRRRVFSTVYKYNAA